MASKQSSQTQQKATDPVQMGLGIWAKLTQEQLDRVNSLWGEVAEVEGRAYERARQAFEEADALSREYVKYLADLSAEWRRMFLDTTRRAADALSAMG